MTQQEAVRFMALADYLHDVDNKFMAAQLDSDKYNEATMMMGDAIRILRNMVIEFCPSAKRYCVVYGNGHTEDYDTSSAAMQEYKTNPAAVEVYSYNVYGECHTLKTREAR